ncbi:MAG: hypothetical protein ACYTGQ_10420, partial [Planctomycetota bacterium]
MSRTAGHHISKLAVLISCLLASGGSYAQLAHDASSNAYVKQFRVIGPFHQKGLETDHFPRLMEIEFIDNERQLGMTPDKHDSVLAETGPDHFIDFNKVLADGTMAVAYAQFEVEALEEREVLFVVSAADGAKIYLNGKTAHASYGGMGRNYLHFYAEVHKGKNNVVIKVPNRGWDWRLSVRILDQQEAAAYLERSDDEDEFQQFLHSKLRIKTGASADPRFRPGRFPELVFDNPQLVKKHLGGSYRIKTRWFDRDLAEVRYPR